jgi:protease-4
MNFFKAFLASCLGSLIALVVFCFISVFLFIGVISNLSNADALSTVQDNSVLHLKLDVPITEAEIEDPLEGLPIPGAVASIGLLPLKRTLEHAKNDPKIKGIYLDLNMFMDGYGVAREIRQALEDFKSSGKWIVAYSEFYTEQAYYIVSVADKVYLNPEGEIEFNGLAVEVSFFKKLFDKLDIKPQIFRVGDFKSAVEPFMLDRMSAENKLQLNELISDINSSMLKDIAESRGIEINRLREMSNKMLVTNTQTSLALGLIDSLYYFDQVQQDLRNRLSIQ